MPVTHQIPAKIRGTGLIMPVRGVSRIGNLKSLRCQTPGLAISILSYYICLFGRLFIARGIIK